MLSCMLSKLTSDTDVVYLSCKVIILKPLRYWMWIGILIIKFIDVTEFRSCKGSEEEK